MSTIISLDFPRDAEETAAYWVMRLNDNDLTDGDRKVLHLWIDSDPEHAALLDSYARIWCLSQTVLATSEEKSGHANATLHRRRFTWMRTAVACIAIVATLFWPMAKYEQADSNVVAAEFETQLGVRKAIALPDGSRVTLAQGSALGIRFEEWRRYLQLDRGTAEFDVAHDSTRPFDVEVDNHIVRAVGTRFSVARELSGGITVRVTEGRVVIFNRDTTSVEIAKLSAEQAVTINQDTLLFTTSRNKPDDGALSPPATLPMRAGGRPQEGKAALTFRNERLDVVVDHLNRRTLPRIRIEGEGLSERRISGYYSGGDATAFLEALAESEQLEIEQSADRTLILKPQGR